MQNNPMLNQLGTNNTVPDRLDQIKGMIQILKGSKNPNAMMEYLMAANPEFKEVMNLVRQNGGSPKDAFYALAKQKGVDPDEIIAMLK